MRTRIRAGSLGFAAALLAAGVLLGSPAPVAAARPDCTEAANAAQSALAEACPCNAAEDHSAHVRCVARKLKELSACTQGAEGRTCGPVPRACVGRIRKVASRSACGKRDAVTCCVPRQHDCVGDATVGDGRKDGTCAGSRKPCDQAADCKLPRCQLMPDTERCTAFGGTPGKTKDCATACAD